ncbi:MAG TPA: M48 family metallopeptidase [Candidatus Polarisedimenticolia bacterium]|nr:M48 family metallopeptidase [Candidatus Polarisedimenticolia bacterium]
MHRQPSLAGRAILAIALMIGFYLLAVGVAAALLAVPYFEMVALNRVDLKIAFFCLVGAGVILWSILPRFDAFPSPGPTLTPGKHPALFRAIESVARATGQSMPAEVFLVADMNAWVAQRGGVMGLGSRRVMGLGLPLLQAVTVAEFRAILAHEFGHFHGGDTRLGPWIYKTRAALGRTLAGMARHSQALRRPFEWYGSMFLRVTHGISRRQELTADALACRVESPGALVGGLRRISGMSVAWNAYWATEVSPVLASGFLPPIADGLRRYSQVTSISEKIEQMIEADLREGKSDPFDTHPPLRERIEAAEAVVAVAPPEGRSRSDASPEAGGAAVSLLAAVPALERELLMFIADAAAVAGLKPVSWEDVGSTVIANAWDHAVNENRAAFSGLTVGALFATASQPGKFEATLPRRPETVLDEAGRKRRGAWHLGAGLGHALLRAGWAVTSLPGEPIRLARGSDIVEPFEAVQSMADQTLTEAAWQGRCSDLGIAGLGLEPPGR